MFHSVVRPAGQSRRVSPQLVAARSTRIAATRSAPLATARTSHDVPRKTRPSPALAVSVAVTAAIASLLYSLTTASAQLLPSSEFVAGRIPLPGTSAADLAFAGSAIFGKKGS